MPLIKKAISDITGEEIKGDEAIHIYEDFGWNSDFDTGILLIYTTKKELEKLFGKSIGENSKIGFCFDCDKNILEENIKNCERLSVRDINSLFNYIQEKYLNIEKLNIDICNECLKIHFEKYITYND